MSKETHIRYSRSPIFFLLSEKNLAHRFLITSILIMVQEILLHFNVEVKGKHILGLFDLRLHELCLFLCLGNMILMTASVASCSTK